MQHIGGASQFLRRGHARKFGGLTVGRGSSILCVGSETVPAAQAEVVVYRGGTGCRITSPARRHGWSGCFCLVQGSFGLMYQGRIIWNIIRLMRGSPVCNRPALRAV
jgi:hypothetical protein